MTASRTPKSLENKWDIARAADMSEPEKLLYRSNLLGSDKRITNYGGGNTSAKVMQTDPLTGEMVEVLWVKGSGGDVGSIRMDGFSTLYMDKLNALRGIYRGVEFEDEMVALLPHCTFNLNPRAASIDTPLHAYVPARHVDHMHPDAIIAIAAAKDSRALTRTSTAARSAGCRGSGRATSSASGLKISAWKTPRQRAWCWKATGCSPGPTMRKDCYETDASCHPDRDGLVRSGDRRQGRLRWGPPREPARRSPPRDRRPPDAAPFAAWSRATSSNGRPFRRRATRFWSSSIRGT